MAAGLKELEGEITIETTTGSILKYKYKYKRVNGVLEITRTIETPQGTNTVITTIEDIKKDANMLLAVVKHLETFHSMTVNS